MRWTHLLLALWLVVPSGSMIEAQTPPAKGEEFVLYHVVASGKKTDKKQVVAKALAAFEKNLKRYPFAGFELAGKQSVKITTKASTIKLPRGYGKVSLAMSGSSKVRVHLQGTKKDATFTGSFPVQKPVFVASDKMKNKKGDLYILILAKSPKKK